jgi:benzil reductase ((S)-benzoin forming)
MAGVFISGVSSGIGHALAKRYLATGWDVFGVSRRKPEDLFAEPHFHFQSIDLTKLEEIEPALRKFLHEVRALELAILNAGVLGPIGDLVHTPVSDMKHVLEVNLWANKVLIDTFVKMGVAVRRVVTMSSGVAVHGGRGWNAYSISKAALNMLTALYANELPKTHFCALAPGIIDTHMQEQIAGLPDDEEFESFERLRQAKGTPSMPSPEAASEKLMRAIENAVSYPSGEFLSIDELVKRSWI